MRSTTAYTSAQSVTMDGNRAFEELYVRLARWTAEARELGDAFRYEQLVDKCLALLGYMDPIIDPSLGGEIALTILGLNRFAIGTLVRAKHDRRRPLEGLPELFYSLADIFKAIELSSSIKHQTLSDQC